MKTMASCLLVAALLGLAGCSEKKAPDAASEALAGSNPQAPGVQTAHETTLAEAGSLDQAREPASAPADRRPRTARGEWPVSEGPLDPKQVSGIWTLGYFIIGSDTFDYQDGPHNGCGWNLEWDRDAIYEGHTTGKITTHNPNRFVPYPEHGGRWSIQKNQVWIELKNPKATLKYTTGFSKNGIVMYWEGPELFTHTNGVVKPEGGLPVRLMLLRSQDVEVGK